MVRAFAQMAAAVWDPDSKVDRGGMRTCAGAGARSAIAARHLISLCGMRRLGTRRISRIARQHAPTGRGPGMYTIGRRPAQPRLGVIAGTIGRFARSSGFNLKAAGYLAGSVFSAGSVVRQV